MNRQLSKIILLIVCSIFCVSLVHIGEAEDVSGDSKVYCPYMHGYRVVGIPDEEYEYREMPNFHVLSVDTILVENLIINNDHVVLEIDSADSMLTDMVFTYEIVDRNLEICFYGFIDRHEEWSSGSCFVIWAQAERYDTISVVDGQESRTIYSMTPLAN